MLPLLLTLTHYDCVLKEKGQPLALRFEVALDTPAPTATELKDGNVVEISFTTLKPAELLFLETEKSNAGIILNTSSAHLHIQPGQTLSPGFFQQDVSGTCLPVFE